MPLAFCAWLICPAVQVFSFDLVDKDAGEIKVTGFNEMCDKFFHRIEEGKVYQISKASVKPKKQGNVRPPLSMPALFSLCDASLPAVLDTAMQAHEILNAPSLQSC